MKTSKLYFCTIILLALSSYLIAQVDIDKSSALLLLLKEAREKNDHKKLAETYLALAELESKENFNQEKSFEYYANSLIYFKLLKDTVQINAIDLKIANGYLASGSYSDAEKIFLRLLDYYKSHTDTANVLTTYLQLSDLSKKRGNTDEQYNYLKTALSLNLLYNDVKIDIRLLLDKAQILANFNELDSAIIVSYEAFKKSKETNERIYAGKSLFYIGKYNRLKANYQRAIKYLNQALDYSINIPFDTERLLLYDELSTSYERVNDHQNAYAFLQKYTALNDSILNKERFESINDIQRKYQTTEKNKDIQNLEKEKEFVEAKNTQQRIALYLLAAGFTLLLILIYYIIRFYSQKIKTEHIINEQKEEINDRKIKELQDNLKISSMQSMIEGQEIERERVAQDLHDSLGGLLATVKLAFDGVKVKVKSLDKSREYNHAHKLLDHAVAEVRSISQNMQPGALKELGLVAAIKDLINRFDEEQYPEIDFQHYEVPNNLKPSVSLSIYRVIQELLHNSIKHAEASEILIQINKEDDLLVIQYEDDGKGFDPDKLKRKGMGLDNINSRINYLKGKIELDTKPNQGTSYLISVDYD